MDCMDGMDGMDKKEVGGFQAAMFLRDQVPELDEI